MGDYFQSTNINAGQYYLNGQPLTTGGGEPHTMLPVGSIIMWNGTVANTPPGWHICNGENGTPDLRNRFVIGAGDKFNPTDSGGNAKIKADNLPPHKHNNTLADGGHFHDIEATLNTIGENAFDNYETKTQNTANVQTSNITMTSATANITITNVINETNYDEYYPPYYALCYIMFTGQ